MCERNYRPERRANLRELAENYGASLKSLGNGGRLAEIAEKDNTGFADSECSAFSGDECWRIPPAKSQRLILLNACALQGSVRCAGLRRGYDLCGFCRGDGGDGTLDSEALDTDFAAFVNG